MFITLFLLASTVGSPAVEFKLVHTDLIFNEPIQVIVEESNPSIMYVVEKDGLVRSASFDIDTKEKPIFLDITDRVKITNDEEGLLSFVFDPNYRENGWMYVWYSAQNPKRGVLSRFTKDKDGNTIVVGKVGDEKQEEKTLGNRLKFKLEFMMMMLLAGRKDEASKMYDQLVAEFDKLA